MGLADLHVHSLHSYDATATVSAILKHVADQTDLDVIAITDHDSMDGVREALSLAPRYGVEVIPGMELSTADGPLLALYIDHPIPAGLPLEESVLRVRAQGGLCIAAHPTAWGTESLSFEKIRQALEVPGVAGCLVGVEAYNGGLVYTRENLSVARRSAQLPLAQTANSDAHVLITIGSCATQFEGRSAADLRRALVNHQTVPMVGEGLTGLQVITSYIPQYLLRKMGWAPYSAGPDAPISYARISRLPSFQPA